MFKIQSNPLNTDTSSLRTVFLCPWGKKALTFSLHSTHLKKNNHKGGQQTLFSCPINKINLARADTSLPVMSCSGFILFDGMKKIQLTACRFPSALQYTGYDDLYTSISLIILAPNEFSRELILKCFREFGRRNDGFVMARDV